MSEPTAVPVPDDLKQMYEDAKIDDFYPSWSRRHSSDVIALIERIARLEAELDAANASIRAIVSEQATLNSEYEATMREKDEALVKAKQGLESAGMGCRYIDATLAKKLRVSTPSSNEVVIKETERNTLPYWIHKSNQLKATIREKEDRIARLEAAIRSHGCAAQTNTSE